MKDQRSWLRSEAQKIARRLKPAEGGRPPLGSGPELGSRKMRYEVADRVRAISCGGIGAIHRLARKVGLVDALHSRLPILKRRRPHSEADHILKIAYNVMCGGSVLDDIETRRQDRAFLDALGARTIPDPTTAGDFCRRFDRDHIHALMDIINDVRIGVWQRLPTLCEETARIDCDGSLVETSGECKQGMDVAYNGIWGYHPMVVSLANTAEPLFIVNRSGNRPSQEGAPDYFSRAIDVCRKAGWTDILLRGDTAFSQTDHFDRWTDDGVRFVFGYNAYKPMIARAESDEASDFTQLIREADAAFAEQDQRAKQPQIKEEIIRERGFKNLRLVREDVAEFEHVPGKASCSYRFIALRKTIIQERGQRCLRSIHRYFFYVTNDRTMAREDVVKEANGRCNQENLLAQLKGGVGALRAPLNTLESNWAYMVIASLAWSLKAWFSLLLPVRARHRERDEAERRRILRMEFRSFVQRLIMVPAQILNTGRTLVYRLLAWRPDLPVLFRFLDAL